VAVSRQETENILSHLASPRQYSLSEKYWE
ncbi:hypothetical protein A2U01_0086144, partial [Trifolium medium]|nr:hypothetical protein [Trifolium medium]